MQKNQIDIEITSYTTIHQTIYYIIKISKGQQEWTIQKRYSEFEVLYKSLYHHYKGIPSLPKKTFVTFLLGKSTEQINERKIGLQQFLIALAARQEVLDSITFQTFLNNKQQNGKKSQLFKENVVEEIQIPTIKQEEQQIEKNEIIIENKEVIQEVENRMVSEQINPSIDQGELFSTENDDNLDTQLKNYQTIIIQKENQIVDLEKKLEEIQYYYNEQLYEKQYQINDLQEKINQLEEQLSQNENQENKIQKQDIQLQQYNSQIIQLKQQIEEQEQLLDKQNKQLGFSDKFGILDLNDQQQLIIDQQNIIDIQIEKNNENEIHLKEELEKLYLIEAEKEELQEINNNQNQQLMNEQQEKRKLIEEIEINQIKRQ